MVFLLTKAAVVAAIITLIVFLLSNSQSPQQPLQPLQPLQEGQGRTRFTFPNIPSIGRIHVTQNTPCDCQLITECLNSLSGSGQVRFCGMEGLQRKICCDNTTGDGQSESSFARTAQVQQQAAQFYRNQFLYHNEGIGVPVLKSDGVGRSGLPAVKEDVAESIVTRVTPASVPTAASSASSSSASPASTTTTTAAPKVDPKQDVPPELLALQKQAGSFLSQYFPEYYQELLQNLTQFDNITFVDDIPVPVDNEDTTASSVDFDEFLKYLEVDYLGDGGENGTVEWVGDGNSVGNYSGGVDTVLKPQELMVTTVKSVSDGESETGLSGSGTEPSYFGDVEENTERVHPTEGSLQSEMTMRSDTTTSHGRSSITSSTVSVTPTHSTGKSEEVTPTGLNETETTTATDSDEMKGTEVTLTTARSTESVTPTDLPVPSLKPQEVNDSIITTIRAPIDTTPAVAANEAETTTTTSDIAMKGNEATARSTEGESTDSVVTPTDLPVPEQLNDSPVTTTTVPIDSDITSKPQPVPDPTKEPSGAKNSTDFAARSVSGGGSAKEQLSLVREPTTPSPSPTTTVKSPTLPASTEKTQPDLNDVLNNEVEVAVSANATESPESPLTPGSIVETTTTGAMNKDPVIGDSETKSTIQRTPNNDLTTTEKSSGGQEVTTEPTSVTERETKPPLPQDLVQESTTKPDFDEMLNNEIVEGLNSPTTTAMNVVDSTSTTAMTPVGGGKNDIARQPVSSLTPESVTTTESHMSVSDVTVSSLLQLSDTDTTTAPVISEVDQDDEGTTTSPDSPVVHTTMSPGKSEMGRVVPTGMPVTSSLAPESVASTESVTTTESSDGVSDVTTVASVQINGMQNDTTTTTPLINEIAQDDEVATTAPNADVVQTLISDLTPTTPPTDTIEESTTKSVVTVAVSSSVSNRTHSLVTTTTQRSVEKIDDLDTNEIVKSSTPTTTTPASVVQIVSDGVTSTSSPESLLASGDTEKSTSRSVVAVTKSNSVSNQTVSNEDQVSVAISKVNETTDRPTPTEEPDQTTTAQFLHVSEVTPTAMGPEVTTTIPTDKTDSVPTTTPSQDDEDTTDYSPLFPPRPNLTTTSNQILLSISTGRTNRSLTNPEALSLATHLGHSISNVVSQLLLTTHTNFHLLPLFTHCANAKKQTRRSKLLHLNIHHHPHVVRIGRYEPGGVVYHCAGTLISNLHVLTAASCVNPTDMDLPPLLLESPDDKIYATVNSTTIHPHYSNSTGLNNIAILKLSQAQDLPPICLPFEDAYGLWDNIPQNPNDQVTLHDWGMNDTTTLTVSSNCTESVICTELLHNKTHPHLYTTGSPLTTLMTRHKVYFQLGLLTDHHHHTQQHTKITHYLQWILDSL